MAWSRASRHERGYGTEWDKLRIVILERDQYLCQPCKRAGRIVAATQVDHKLAKANGGTDDEDNLEAACKPCHDEKTIRDRGHKPRPAIGPDGWPI